MKTRLSALAGKLRASARLALTLLLAAALCIPAQLALPGLAWAETTGTRAPNITIYYGTGETVQGTWQEDTLTLDGRSAYCVEVDSDFVLGISCWAKDPVASGIWSQQLCTQLALVDSFVNSGQFVSTRNGNGNGHVVTDNNEKYAVAQCYIWKFLNDNGYSVHSYGWFGASSSAGLDLTGSDTDAQIYDYVMANQGNYIGHANYYDCGSAQNLACDFSLEPAQGHIVLQKASSDADFVAGNGEYSLQGAVYGIYSNEGCSADSLVGQLETDASGYAKSGALNHGIYYVKETRASKGYELDTKAYSVAVQPNADSLVNADAGSVFEVPQKGAISIRKTSANPDISDSNGNYSLEGALYGVYADADCTQLLAKLQTDASGQAKAEGLSLGNKYVREISAPEGYALDERSYTVFVSANVTTPVNGGSVADAPKNNPIDLLLVKFDDAKQASSELNLPQGAASLANAEFTVRYYDDRFGDAAQADRYTPKRSWVLKSDEAGLVQLDEAHLVSGDALYYSGNGSPCLPLGTVVIQEKTSPLGYLPNSTAFCMQVGDDGESDETLATYAYPSVPDQVKRGDLEFVKMQESTNRRLAGVAFALTSQTTGESHVLVTDANGYASTANSWNAHSQNTNGNDWALEANLQESPAQAGEGAASLQAVQTQSDQALASSLAAAETDGSSEGKDNNTVAASEDSSSDAAGTGSDAAEADAANSGSDAATPSEETAAKQDSASGSSQEAAAKTQAAEDANSTQAESESATAQALAEQSASEQLDDGAGIWFGFGDDGSCSLAVDDSRGALPYDSYTITELPCQANEGLQLISASAVVSRDKVVVDLGTIDDPQASICTSARDGEDGDKSIACSEAVEIVDRVSYANLIPGDSYTLNGTLMDKASGQPVVDGDGNPVTASTVFTAESQDGFVDMSFSLSTIGLENASLVVFEELACNGRIVAEHADIEDIDQSVSVAGPAISTSASDSYDGDQVISAEDGAGIVDRVAYTGLNPGREYRIEATLMDKASEAPFINSNGEEVHAQISFTPESASGNVDVALEFDAAGLSPESKLVVFEDLYVNGKLCTSHADLESGAQSLTVVQPEIRTSLADGQTGEKNISLQGNVELVDTVSYSGLTAGQEYVLNGSLMDKASGENLKDANGNAIQASTSFVPESSDGTAQVVFSFDAAVLAGEELVAFESLSRNDAEVAVHADLNDEAQTVVLNSPQVRTSASDAEDGDKQVKGESTVKIVDSVRISNAVPGREYTLVGVMMDKVTGMPLIQGVEQNNEATAVDLGRLQDFWKQLLACAGFEQKQELSGDVIEFTRASAVDMQAARALLDSYPDMAGRMVLESKTITPESSSFTQDMDFTFLSTGLSGQTVVFEALVDNESGQVVAIHANIDDADQTIEILAPTKPGSSSSSKAPSTVVDKTAGKGSAYDKTGNLLRRWAWLAGLLAAAACTSAVVLARQHSSKGPKR